MGGSVTKHDSEDVLADQYGLPGGGGQPALALGPGVARPPPAPEAGIAPAVAELPDSTVLEGDSRFVNDDMVPAVFKWQHGGADVYITGTFTNWREHKRMNRSGNDFTYMAMLPRGKHQFKFIVDGSWRWATDIRTETDSENNVNNIVDLTEFRRDDAEPLAEPDSDDEEYGTSVPDEVTYTKEPPYLPPQLRHILLNAAPLPAAHGTPVLPEPLPVTLDHLYCTAIRDGVMVQGLTRRFRSKHTSTVFYTLMPISPTLKVAEAAGWHSSHSRTGGHSHHPSSSVPPTAAGVPSHGIASSSSSSSASSSSHVAPGPHQAAAGLAGGTAGGTAHVTASGAGSATAGTGAPTQQPGGGGAGGGAGVPAAPPLAMSEADRAAIGAAVRAVAANPQASRAVAVGLSDGLREVMLSVLRSRLEHLSTQLHQSALREYQQAGRALNNEQTARLFDAVKGQAHRKLSTEDTDYRVIYGLLQLAHQAQQAAQQAAAPPK